MITNLCYVADMTKSMRKVCEYEIELTDVERELLAIGYKNVMTTKRASLRALSSIEEKEDSKGNKQNVKLINKKLEIVKHEFFSVCNDILSLIDSHLIPSTTNVESTVYYYAMWVTSHHHNQCRYRHRHCFFLFIVFLGMQESKLFSIYGRVWFWCWTWRSCR